MKIGIIFCAYNCETFLERSLPAWRQASDELEEIEEICVISSQFVGFPEKDNGPTLRKVSEMLASSKATVINSPKPLSEHEARNIPLHYFKEIGVDYVWLVDADELYTLEQIKGIISFLKNEPFAVWLSINFKNCVFDEKQWIDGFCPPRIFKTEVVNHNIDEFYWDNDVNYLNRFGEKVSYQSLPTVVVPKAIAHVKHLSWINSVGKDKVEYQKKHFGRCSFQWNEETQSLEFDFNYFLLNAIPLPTVHKEQ
jgi:glycosyltransferase involved in cell wall biosynthesis